MKEQRKIRFHVLCVSFLLLALGVGLLFLFNSNIVKRKRSMSWLSTKGTITKLSFDDCSDAADPLGTSFIVDLEYSYHVKDNDYIGTQINISVWRWMVNGKGRKWFEENSKVGTQVEVFYNPASPSEAVLIRGKAGCENQTLSLAIIMILGGVTFLIIVIYDYRVNSS